MGEWKPTEEMIARGEAFRGECFAVDYGFAPDEENLAERMRERERWYNAGWQGRKRYEAEVECPADAASMKLIRETAEALREEKGD